MRIPEKLKGERFIRIRTNSKLPLEKEWNTKNNYNYEDFHKKFPNDKNYGVLCGGNTNLIVIDCDSKNSQEAMMEYPEIIETFTVKTAGKGLYHFYFHITSPKTPNEQEGFQMDDIKTKQRLFDVQGHGRYVIGPGSKIDNKVYETTNDRDINNFDYVDITNLLINLLPGSVVVGEKKKLQNEFGNELSFLNDPVINAIKKMIKPVDLLPDKWKTAPGVNTMCPLGHPSESQQCFTHNRIVWRCYHCDKRGDVITLYMLLNNCTFHEAKRSLAKRAGLSDDLQSKFLIYYGDKKTKHMASELLSKELVKMNQIRALRGDANKSESWIYMNGVYVPHGRTYLTEKIRAIMDNKYNSAFDGIIQKKIEADTYITSEKFFEVNEPNKVPVFNGILNLDTRIVSDFTSEEHYFNKIPIAYDPQITPKKTILFMKDVLEDNDDIILLQEIFGYLLFRKHQIEKIFMFVGHGRNGKSKLLKLMKRFLGDKNVLGLGLQELASKDDFQTSELFGKYANIGGDIPNKAIVDTSRIKKLSGGDSFSHKRKFLGSISFSNHAKMLFACNELPEADDNSEGYYDRWIFLNFPWKFVDDPTEEHHKKINVNIIDEISNPKEMSGLLNWALDGYDRLMKNGKFSLKDKHIMTKKKWDNISSNFSTFLDINVEQSPTDFLTLNDLNVLYQQYCMDNQIIPETNQRKNKYMMNIGAVRTKTSISGKSQLVYRGVKLINGPLNFETPNEEELQLF